MINKDFLKLIFADQKKLISLADMRSVTVPKYDELSVKNVYPMIKNNPFLSVHFPDEYPKGRMPDRDYVFNVLHTKQPEYVQNLIRHA
jgi:hypothetical protein